MSYVICYVILIWYFLFFIEDKRDVIDILLKVVLYFECVIRVVLFNILDEIKYDIMDFFDV